jgi:hypothetical protein
MSKKTANKALIGLPLDAHAGSRATPVRDGTESTELTIPEKALLWAPCSSGAQPISEGAGRKISQELLINRLNFVNFQEGRIELFFAPLHAGRTQCIQAFPLPCIEPILECRWPEKTVADDLNLTHALKYILVPRGEKFIQAIPEAIEIQAGGCRMVLPESGWEISQRRVERQRCHGIAVDLVQKSLSVSGSLLDFTAASFRVEFRPETAQRLDGMDAHLPVQVIFHAGRQTLYSSECRIIRTSSAGSHPSCVLEPLQQEVRRYRKAEFRSERQILNPSPNMIFRHPLSLKRVELKVIDLSGSGFSVEENESASMLLPGLILPEVELCFSNLINLKCSVQVVFRKPALRPSDGCRVRCGLALIDVTASDHIKLLGILHQVKDQNAYVSNAIDLDALWDFLFETGFIYPAKYALIAKNKGEIKKTYTKLYTRSPDIARHFVYQDNGVILGHIAMIRFWQNTWLIHHHAARRFAAKKAGIAVLRQISHFIHDTFRLRSLHMDYLACYYRPQNKFPQRVFGGFAHSIKNPKACSIDAYAYLRLPGIYPRSGRLPGGWELLPATGQNLRALSDFYDRVSGGLMLKAFDLESSGWRTGDLEREYEAHGLKRKRRLYALNQHGRLKVLMDITVSDVGLNLSDLTRCVHAIVLDRKGLTSDVFTASVQLAARSAGLDDVVALVYPEVYPLENSIAVDKTYHLWTFHAPSAGQAYLSYLNRLTRHL